MRNNLSELEKRAGVRKLDHDRLELMIAELEDLKTRHHSMYLKIKCNGAIEQLQLAQAKLLELNEQFAALEK